MSVVTMKNRALTCAAAFVAALIFALPAGPAPLSAAPAPIVWKPSDLPRTHTAWYGIEIARFPSKLIAEGIQKTLTDANWRPVSVVPDLEEGDFAVIVGEVSGVGEAHLALKELSVSKVAQGKIVRMTAKSGEPRGFTGPVPKPFAWRPDLTPEEREKLATEMMQIVRDEVWRLSGDENEAVKAFIEFYDNEKFRNPAVAEGAVAMANFFWTSRRDAGPTLFLASKVASGDWPAPTSKPELEYRAEEIAFEHLYATRRDWRGAWRAAEAMGSAARPNSPARGWSLLRRAALLVDLIERGEDPMPTMAEVRSLLRRAQDAAPTSEVKLLAKIELVYLQTFAWEGDWARVENLASAFTLRHKEQPAELAQARTLLAQSLERRNAFDEAREQLALVTKMTIPPDDLFRFGNEVHDPQPAASALWEHMYEVEEKAKKDRKAAQEQAEEAAKAAAAEAEAEAKAKTEAAKDTPAPEPAADVATTPEASAASAPEKTPETPAAETSYR